MCCRGLSAPSVRCTFTPEDIFGQKMKLAAGLVVLAFFHIVFQHVVADGAGQADIKAARVIDLSC